ncbi:MAG: hypothetical protein ACREQ5_20605, partial [Candidatus Dormibacteria bacterium]
QYEAVRRLEREIAAACGVTRGVGLGAVVQPATMIEPYVYAQIAASERVGQVLGRVGERDRLLLCAMLARQFAGLTVNWRETVYEITGETHEHVQAGCVRGAAENLRLAWIARDKGPKKAA